MYIIVLIIFFICVYLGVKTANSTSILRPSFWLFIAYIFLLLTHLFAGINYHFGNIYRILPYFILCLMLLVFGERIGRTVNLKASTAVLTIKSNTLALLSIIGSALFVFDILRLNPINFGTRIEDFNVSNFGVIGNALSSFGLLVWLNSLYNYRINKLKIPSMSYLSIVSFVAGGVLSAGRQAVILVVISSVIMLVWSNAKEKESTLTSKNKTIAPRPWGFYIIICLFVSYFMFVSLVRSGIFDIDNKMAGYEKEMNATTSPETKKIIHNIGGLSDVYLEFSYYYSHELIRLDLLYQNYDYHPTFGLSEMLYLERRVQWLFGKQADIAWQHVTIAIEDRGRFTVHTWSTFIADFLVDFGRIGAPIACSIVGFIYGILYRKFKKSQNSVTIIRQCIICTGIVFSIQYSPIAELIYFIPLMLCSFITIQPIEYNSKLI
jgi:hypothetical protein